MGKAIAIVSGGLDSVTLAYYLRGLGYRLSLLSFSYGQKHFKELLYAAQHAQLLGADFEQIDLTALRKLFSGSALTDGGAIPNGHYADASMTATIVPNRNAVMLALAYAAAVSQNAQAVALGVHAGDHPIYPDCRPRFIYTFDKMERIATDRPIELLAPFLHKTKSEIIQLGARLGIDYARTWSCYNGRAKHCGKCGTCVERKEAFQLANVQDPTEYE